jgi:hypothetical protein
MRLLDLSPLRIGEGSSAQPGLSMLQNEKWTHGNEALAACRLDPQSVCADVWVKLSLDPIVGADHRAMLAVQQLTQRISNRSGVWTALTPDAWAKPALQVFLGVARECGLDVRLLLSRAAAVAALSAVGDSCSVLEWAWHSLRAVHVVRDNDGWRFADTRLLVEGGVFDFYRRESRLAAEITLGKTRRDPLDTAANDQALFDGWWNWRTRGTPWICGDLDLSAEAPRFRALHEDWLQKLALNDTPETILPAPLRNLLGFSEAQTEPAHLMGLLSRLEEPAQPGARWKASIPAQAGPALPPPVPLTVTHVVVNGLASRCTAEQAAGLSPGRSLVLPDGRSALAIHVPES